MESPQNQNINLDIEIRQPISKKEYAKKYYESNKDKMKTQTREAFLKMDVSDIKRKKIIEKLNTNSFKRIPLKTLKKHNISFNEEQKRYI
jgi:hypothetical protein